MYQWLRVLTWVEVCHWTTQHCHLSAHTDIDNIRVMMIVWWLRGNIIRTALCWIVWHNVHSPQHTYMSSTYRSNRLGLSHWDPYAVHRGGCLELYYCNMVEWFWCDSSLIFDDQLVSFSALTVLVWSSRPVKIVPEMTYNVLSGTLNLYSSTVSTLVVVVFRFMYFQLLTWCVYSRPIADMYAYVVCLSVLHVTTWTTMLYSTELLMSIQWRDISRSLRSLVDTLKLCDAMLL